MVKEIGRNIQEPHSIKLLRLTDFNLLPCKGCYRCLFDEAGCPQPDDFHTVLEKIVEADALILAAPTYFLGGNGILKLFLDRGLSFYAHAENLWAKPSIGIGIAGIEGREGYTMLSIENFLKIMLSEIKLSKTVYGALPGEIFLNEANKSAAKELALALFDSPTEKQTPHCPICGGDTFRFLSDTEVRCMLCSNSGSLSIQNGMPAFTIQKSGHELFLTKEGVLKHREWLKSMKERFIEQKKELRAITGPYRKEGKWIKPQSD
jgi:multimeric flavodoxin WrbA